MTTKVLVEVPRLRGIVPVRGNHLNSVRHCVELRGKDGLRQFILLDKNTSERQQWRMKHFESRRVFEATPMLLSKLKIDPKDGFAICDRGVFFASHGEFVEAIKEWTIQLALNPNDTLALSNIAWVRSTCLDDALRDGKQAVEYATKACEVSEWKHPGFLETLAVAYAETNDFANAIKWQEKVIEFAGTSENRKLALVERLDLFQANKPFRDGPKNALEYYSKPIDNEPTNAFNWLARGSYWQEKSEFDKALADYNEGIRLDSTNWWAYEERGTTLLSKGDYVAACEDLTAAIKLNPQSPKAHAIRGICWRKKGEFDKAISDFMEAINLDQNEGSVYCYLANLRATCPDDRYRDGKEAIQLATKACDLSEWRYWVALDTLAAAYAESGEFANAIKWAEKSLETVPEKDRQRVTERLERYRAGKPYRDLKLKPAE